MLAASRGEARRGQEFSAGRCPVGTRSRTPGAPWGDPLRSLARGVAGTTTAVFLHLLGERGDLCAFLAGLPQTSNHPTLTTRDPLFRPAHPKHSSFSGTPCTLPPALPSSHSKSYPVLRARLPACRRVPGRDPLSHSPSLLFTPYPSAARRLCPDLWESRIRLRPLSSRRHNQSYTPPLLRPQPFPGPPSTRRCLTPTYVPLPRHPATRQVASPAWPPC